MVWYLMLVQLVGARKEKKNVTASTAPLAGFWGMVTLGKSFETQHDRHIQ